MVSPNVHVLMYHDVRDATDTAWPKRYALRSFVSATAFHQHLDRITRLFTPVSLRQALAILDGAEPAPRQRPAVLITFDDGLADHARVVAPMLRDRHLPACFFIPVTTTQTQDIMHTHKIQFILAAAESEAAVVAAIFHEIDQLRSHLHIRRSNAEIYEYYSASLHKDNWWSKDMIFVTRFLRSSLPDHHLGAIIDHLFDHFVTRDHADFHQQLYLTPQEVKQMAADGFDIGGHGYRSVNMAGRPIEDQYSDALASFEFLATMAPDYTRAGPVAMSYPNGGNDAVTRSAIAAAGFGAAFTIIKEPATPRHERLQLPRWDGAQDDALIDAALTVAEAA